MGNETTEVSFAGDFLSRVSLCAHSLADPKHLGYINIHQLLYALELGTHELHVDSKVYHICDNGRRNLILRFGEDSDKFALIYESMEGVFFSGSEETEKALGLTANLPLDMPTVERLLSKESYNDNFCPRSITGGIWAIMAGCTCQGCGQKFIGDIVTEDELWEKIKPEGKPEGGGLLCPSCVMERAVLGGHMSAGKIADVDFDPLEIIGKFTDEYGTPSMPYTLSVESVRHGGGHVAYLVDVGEIDSPYRDLSDEDFWQDIPHDIPGAPIGVGKTVKEAMAALAKQLSTYGTNYPSEFAVTYLAVKRRLRSAFEGW